MKHGRTAVLVALALVVVAGGWAAFRLLRPEIPADLRPTARALLDACPGSTDERRVCYRARLGRLVQDSGVAVGMATLKDLARADRTVEREGHVYAHGMGIAAYLDRRSVPETFEGCTTDFASGCNHGVIQAYLESQPAVDSATVNQLCAGYRDSGDRWQLFQCVHGMGHGLDMMKGGDLPDALRSCDLLGDAWDRDACYGGAFMENIMEEIDPHHPASELTESHHHGAGFKRLDPDDLLYPCSILEQRYLRACYLIHTSAVLFYTKNDIAKTAEVCASAPEDMRPVCFRSLGRDLTSRALRRPSKTRRLCRKVDAADREACYVGAAKALIDWSATAESGMALCRLVRDEPGGLSCFHAVGQQIYALTAAPEERARSCAGAGSVAAVEACRRGAGL